MQKISSADFSEIEKKLVKFRESVGVETFALYDLI
jgi:hypothetical protein